MCGRWNALRALFFVIFCSFSPAAMAAGQSLVMADFVVMSEGHGLTERDNYDARATPIAARYGIKRLASLDVLHNFTMKGFKVKRLDLWLLPSVKALQAWGDDPEYKALLPYRDRVHDMKVTSLYFAHPAMPLRKLGEGHYFIEMFRAGAGFDRGLFARFKQQSVALGAKYGAAPVAALNITKKILGKGPMGQRLNLWKLTSEQQFLAWVRSAEYKALEPMRQRLFDGRSHLMLVGKSR